MNNARDLANAFSVVKTVALVAHTDELLHMWTGLRKSLPRVLKNVYSASGRQSHRARGNKRLNHHG
jgi:hypothetical protein